ncbi:MAG: hypothetical protein JWP12_3266 [Bacteroidetes bacterium]|nr:hypothetical protein [Bacteroidota bacterium]
MIRILLASLFAVFSTLNCFSQTANWGWLQHAGGTANEECMGVTTDANGNVYATGYYTSPSITLGAITLTNPWADGSHTAIYVVKYDINGNVIWAKSAGGQGSDVGQAITTDTHGNVYVTGSVGSAIVHFDSYTVTGGTSWNFYIVKYDSTGTVLWAKEAGGTSTDAGMSVSADTAENVYVTGMSYSISLTIGGSTYTRMGTDAIFNVKYDAAGNIVWSNYTTGTCTKRTNSVKSDPAGNSVVGGFFYNSNILFDTIPLANHGGLDAYVIKYNSSGRIIWGKSFGNTGDEAITGVTIDADSNVIATGYFSSPTINVSGITLTSSGGYDAFIVKYNAAGTILWAKNIGGTGTEQANGIASDVYNNIYVTGYYDSPVVPFDAISITNAAPSKVFVAQCDASGNFMWAQKCGGTGNINVHAITVDDHGNSYIGGFYQASTIAFDTTSLSNTGGGDLFIAQITDITTNVQEEATDLKNNLISYPNPSASSTTVMYTLTEKQNVTLAVYNELGKLMYTFSKNELREKGDHQYQYTPPSPGIYFIKLITGNTSITKKMIFID